MAAHVLLVEDDDSLGPLVKRGLEREGYEVSLETQGGNAMRRWAEADFDLVILDLILPDRDGLSVCRQIREASDVPILILTGRVRPEDAVLGLESGADEYLRKPLDLRELNARVRTLLRRFEFSVAQQRLSVGSLRIDALRRCVQKNGKDVPLSATEYRLLIELVKNAGKVMSRTDLLELVWGCDYLGGSRLIDMAIKRLRDKLEDNPSRPALIKTVRRSGYSFQAP